MKVPDKLVVVEFQYFLWEGVWSDRVLVRHTPNYPHHVIHGWFKLQAMVPKAVLGIGR